MENQRAGVPGILAGRLAMVQFAMTEPSNSALLHRLLLDEEIGVFRDISSNMRTLFVSLQREDEEVLGPVWCVGSCGSGQRSTLTQVSGPFAIEDEQIEQARWSAWYLIALSDDAGSPAELLAAFQGAAEGNGFQAMSAFYAEDGIRAITCIVLDPGASAIAWAAWEAGSSKSGTLPDMHSDWGLGMDEAMRIGCELLRPIPDALESGVASVLWMAEVPELAPSFLEQQVTVEVLYDLSDADLRELGVAALGTRKRILRAIADRKELSDQADERDAGGGGSTGARAGAPPAGDDGATEMAPDLPLAIPADPPGPANWEDAVAAIRPLVDGIKTIEVAPGREHPKLEALKAYASEFSVFDRVLLLYDDTLFRSAKDGMVVTEKGIFWRNSFAKPGAIEWNDFQSATARKSEVVLEPGLHAVSISFGGAQAAVAIAAALNAVAEVVRVVIAWEAGAEQRKQQCVERAREARAKELTDQGYRLRTVRFRCGACGGSGLCREWGRTGRCGSCNGNGYDHNGHECFRCYRRGTCRECQGRATCDGCDGVGVLEGPRWVR
jgi:hypothetical protein